MTRHDSTIGRLLVATLLATLIAIAPTATAQRYHDGEKLHYRVAYRAKLFPNTELATAIVETSADTIDGRRVHRVFGEGKIMPTYRWFFNIDDRYTIWVDTLTRRTLRFECDNHEGNYTFRSRYLYDWDAMQVRTWSQSRNREPKEVTLSLTNESMDALSLYFNLRAVDLNSFVVGESRELQMVLEDKIRVLKYRFIGREVCKVPKKGKFRTLHFACTIGTSESFSFTDGSEFSIWISEDENKIPLLLESPIRIGSVRAYISNYEGLRYPLSSQVK